MSISNSTFRGTRSKIPGPPNRNTESGYGIASTDGGIVYATSNTIVGYKRGVWAAKNDAPGQQQGIVNVVGGQIRDCEIGIMVQGGELVALQGCEIQNGSSGIGIDGGSVKLLNTTIQA